MLQNYIFCSQSQLLLLFIISTLSSIQLLFLVLSTGHVVSLLTCCRFFFVSACFVLLANIIAYIHFSSSVLT